MCTHKVTRSHFTLPISQDLGRLNWKCRVWAEWCMFLGQFFVKNNKNHSGTSFDGEEVRKSGNTKIQENKVKCPLSIFKLWKHNHFSRYLFELVDTYTPDSVISPKYIPFFEIGKFPLWNENIVCWLFYFGFKKSPTIQTSEIAIW